MKNFTSERHCSPSVSPSIFDTSQQQRWQVQEQQLKLQILQLETALKADLHDKNQILQRLKAERGVLTGDEGRRT